MVKMFKIVQDASRSRFNLTICTNTNDQIFLMYFLYFSKCKLTAEFHKQLSDAFGQLLMVHESRTMFACFRDRTANLWNISASEGERRGSTDMP